MTGRRILVVDDEAPLLRLMQKYLERAGYAVDACGRAGEAWTLFTSPQRNYALAIVDLTLPDLPGEELVRRMREHKPGLRVIICSGAPAGIEESTGIRYLQKPFLPRMLTDAVAEMLEKDPP